MELNLTKAIELAEFSTKKIVFIRIINEEYEVIYYSPSLKDYLGYSFEDFNNAIAPGNYSLISAYDKTYLKRVIDLSFSTQKDADFNIQVKNAFGKLVTVNGTFSFLGFENGNIFYSTINIESEPNTSTEVKAVTTEKSHREVELGQICTWDYDIIRKKICNYEESFALNNIVLPSDYINKSFSKDNILSPEDMNKMFQCHESLEKGENYGYEAWFSIPNYSYPLYLRIKYVVEFDTQNNPVLAHGMAVNLTDEKNAQNNSIHRAHSALKVNHDSIANFSININDSRIMEYSIENPYINLFFKSKNYDNFLSDFMLLIPDSDERARFLNTFSHENLLYCYDNSKYEISLEHHLYLEKDNEKWVRTVANIDKNPISGNIEAIINISNIHSKKVIDSLINGTIQREFDFIALIYTKTNDFVVIDRFNNSVLEEKTDFIGFMRKELEEKIQNQEEAAKLIAEIDMDNLIDKINIFGSFTLQYNTCDNIDINRHKILRFSFLNNKKNIITLSCRDTTRLYKEEIEQNNKLSKALIEAKKANEAKSQFLSLVSHDIRTPLNGIMGMNQLALKENDLEKIKGYITKAENSSEFLLGLINDILDMSKMEAGKFEFHPETYSYKEFADYINSIIRPLCKKKNQHFSIHTSNCVPAILVDKLRLNQILFNLLSNACKYTKEGGNIQLKINTEKINDNTCIATFVVKDNGIGMSEEFQEHLFETFTQENRMFFTSNEGTGLGLSITHTLVSLMGGEIIVDSEINKGTTFTVQITLPFFDTVEKDNVKASHSSPKSGSKYNGCHFLLCEDNVINQEIAVEILENTGASVDVADDGAKGIETFLSKPDGYYKAIFMDIRMPNMDGLSASKEIRNSAKSDASTIPIIAMTANAMREDKMECIEFGMNAYIAKPIDIKKLYALMDDIIK